MDQSLVEYIKFLEGLDILFFNKYTGLFFSLLIGILLLTVLLSFDFIMRLFNIVEEKQKVIELAEDIKENERNKIILDYRTKRKKFLFSMLMIILTGSSFYLLNNQTIKHWENEVTIAANVNKTILNNPYYQNAVELNKINNNYKTNLLFTLRDAKAYKDLINYLNKKYYLNTLTEEESNILKTIKEID